MQDHKLIPLIIWTIVLLLVIALVALIGAIVTQKVKVNISSSVPVGAYVILSHHGPLTYGALVMTDMPAILQPWWPSRLPVLKPVAGLPGDIMVILEGHFYINEEDYGLVIEESQGMSLPKLLSPTIIQAGEVCLASKQPGSMDCRYSGPLPQDAITGLAQPLLVWGK